MMALCLDLPIYKTFRSLSQCIGRNRKKIGVWEGLARSPESTSNALVANVHLQSCISKAVSFHPSALVLERLLYAGTWQKVYFLESIFLFTFGYTHSKISKD